MDAIVFDLDGVLIDSESVWDDARRAVVAREGGSWRQSATAEMMGMSAPEWSRFMRDELGVPLEPAQIDDAVVAALLARYEQHLPLYPGAVATVNRLAERWPLGLASSSNRVVIDAVLERAGIAERFSATVSSEEVQRGKPWPDVYLAAVRALGVDPGAAVAVEDSTNGLRAAHAAGMLVIAVPNRVYPPQPDALALADLAVASLDRLTPALVATVVRFPRGGRA